MRRAQALGAIMSDRDERIREIAYQLWLLEGRPEGRPDSHWFEAVALYEAEVTERDSAERESAWDPAAEANAGGENQAIEIKAEPTADKVGSKGKRGGPAKEQNRSSRARTSGDSPSGAGENSPP